MKKSTTSTNLEVATTTSETRVLMILQNLKYEKLEFVDTKSAFCVKDSCSPLSENLLPLYEDSNHLNYLGSQRIVEKLMPKILNRIRPYAASGECSAP